MFEGLEWHDDRMLLNGWIYRIEHHRRDDWEGGDHFRFFKIKGLVDAYEAFFRTHPLQPRNVLELGMWDGGSLAFWSEIFSPERLVGVDIEQREDSTYFRRYLEERGLRSRISTYWNTDQADGAALRTIVSRELDGPLDLVFDDASHLYGPTRASFEALFPLLKPGGLYIIEDWAWRHWEAFSPPREWSNHEPPTRLAFELTEAVGTGRGLLQSLSVHQGFLVIERGPLPHSGPLRLDDLIFRHEASLAKRIIDRVVWGRERDLLFRLKERLKKAL